MKITKKSKLTAKTGILGGKVPSADTGALGGDVPSTKNFSSNFLATAKLRSAKKPLEEAQEERKLEGEVSLGPTEVKFPKIKKKGIK